MRYLWEHETWPKLTWDQNHVYNLIASVSHEQGRVQGKMETLGFDSRNETQLIIRTEDVIRSSEIEGVALDYNEVRSSVARRLGLEVGGLVQPSERVEGVVEMMLDATEKYDGILSAERLFAWHSALFRTDSVSSNQINVGCWRDDRNGPMQVVSGPIGQEVVHFQAVPANRIQKEMSGFLRWFADPGELNSLLVAGLAHLWFLTIHPFEDGNGRIARAITDMALARSEKFAHRYYSMSSQICAERKDYYHILEITQRGSVDVTSWMDWFLCCLQRAVKQSDQILNTVLTKARFWARFAQESLNSRQVRVMNKFLDGFEGKLTSSKWAKMAKCSQDTANRDIHDLIQRGGLKKDAAGGRSTSYSLVAD
ncbi:MAG: Fic family protein [Gammaproteobacteria bacterium]|nr:Fic family protein [Gammaproteobacteria bacterium]MYF37613.1 Fic family protein [Gammaproteobacteria bacterium]